MPKPHRWLISLTIVTAALVLTIPVFSSPSIHMRVIPQTAMAPTDVLVRVWVARDAHNRLLYVYGDNHDTFYRSSAMQLDGEDAPGYFEINWHDVPGGEYAFVAVVFNDQDRLWLKAECGACYMGSDDSLDNVDTMQQTVLEVHHHAIQTRRPQSLSIPIRAYLDPQADEEVLRDGWF